MDTVRIEVLPGISPMLTPGNVGTTLFDVALLPGETLGALLARLAGEGQPIGIVLWDLKAEQLRVPVEIVVNGRLYAPVEGLLLALVPGDQIVFVPVYAGGAFAGSPLSPLDLDLFDQ